MSGGDGGSAAGTGRLHQTPAGAHRVSGGDGDLLLGQGDFIRHLLELIE